MVTANSVVIAGGSRVGGGRRAYRGINGDGKQNTIKNKLLKKNKLKWQDDVLLLWLKKNHLLLAYLLLYQFEMEQVREEVISGIGR